MAVRRNLKLTENERASRLADLAMLIRSRREDFGLRQDELADLAGCSTRFISMAEHAKPTLQIDKLLDVLAVLGLELVVRPGHGTIIAGSEAAVS
jgi:HTH-type transcriptional regulator / antitoxin HipB